MVFCFELVFLVGIVFFDDLVISGVVGGLDFFMVGYRLFFVFLFFWLFCKLKIRSKVFVDFEIRSVLRILSNSIFVW